MQVYGRHLSSVSILTLETVFSPVASNTILSGCLLYLDLQLWILPWASYLYLQMFVWNLHLKVL